MVQPGSTLFQKPGQTHKKLTGNYVILYNEKIHFFLRNTKDLLCETSCLGALVAKKIAT
jgi:hypothetical protein